MRTICSSMRWSRMRPMERCCESRVVGVPMALCTVLLLRLERLVGLGLADRLGVGGGRVRVGVQRGLAVEGGEELLLVVLHRDSKLVAVGERAGVANDAQHSGVAGPEPFEKLTLTEVSANPGLPADAFTVPDILRGKAAAPAPVDEVLKAGAEMDKLKISTRLSARNKKPRATKMCSLIRRD